MKLTNPNRQRLFLRRSILWANIYRESIASSDWENTSPADAHRRAIACADLAVKAFDERFREEVTLQPAKEPKPK